MWPDHEESCLQAPVSCNDGKYFLGVRPEHIAATRNDRSELVIGEGTLEVIEPLGAEALLDFNFMGQSIVAKMPWSLDFKRGEQYKLTIKDKDHLHLFDRCTGIRIES